MLNWFIATSRPRYLPGAISTMYRGTTTDEPPMATPPMNRKMTSESQFGGNAEPTAEIKYRIAMRTRMFRRPQRSDGRPTPNAPMSVPISATETVKPCQKFAESSPSSFVFSTSVSFAWHSAILASSLDFSASARASLAVPIISAFWAMTGKYSFCIPFSQPEMTPESKPNRSPPSAETITI